MIHVVGSNCNEPLVLELCVVGGIVGEVVVDVPTQEAREECPDPSG